MKKCEGIENNDICSEGFDLYEYGHRVFCYECMCRELFDEAVHDGAITQFEDEEEVQ